MDEEDGETEKRLVVKIDGGDGGDAVKKDEDDIVWEFIQTFGATEIQYGSSVHWDIFQKISKTNQNNN